MKGFNGSSSCYNFTRGQYVALVSLRSGVAMLSFLACTAVIAIMILFKKYRFQTQRLILYLDIALLLQALAEAMNGLSNEEAISLHKYCVAIGYIDLHASLCVLIAIGVFTMDVFLQATFRCQTQKFEIMYIILTFVFPALLSWIPFAFNAFGFVGAWCWIREYKDDCTLDDEAVLLQFFLYYLPLFLLYPMLFILLLITFLYLYKQRYQYDAQIDPHAPQRRTALRSEIKSLLPYPFIVLLVMLIPLIVRIYQAAKPGGRVFVLTLFDAFFTAIMGAVVSILFTLDRETRRRLRWHQMQAACQEFCPRGRVTEYPADIASSDSRRPSMSLNRSIEQSAATTALLIEEDPVVILSAEYHQLNDD